MSNLIKELQKEIEHIFDVNLLCKKGRASIKTTDARKAFCFLAYEFLNHKPKEIGIMLNKDVSTVSYYRKDFEVIYKTDTRFRFFYDQINLKKYIL